MIFWSKGPNHNFGLGPKISAVSRLSGQYLLVQLMSSSQLWQLRPRDWPWACYIATQSSALHLQCAVYNEHCKVYSVQFTVCIMFSTLNAVQCTVLQLDTVLRYISVDCSAVQLSSIYSVQLQGSIVCSYKGLQCVVTRVGLLQQSSVRPRQQS